MPDMTLEQLSERMRRINFAMLSTITDGGLIASRPMSNNGEVAFDGDSWFFTYETTRTIRDIASESKVQLSFAGDKSLLGKPGIFISVQGDAEVIRDRGRFEEHWTDDLERWFPDGIETPGMVLLRIHAARIHYWDGEEEGEVPV